VVNSNLGHIYHHFRDTTTIIAQNFSLKIAAKPLQIITWLLLTASTRLSYYSAL